jgi:anti-sigma factor RsiW
MSATTFTPSDLDAYLDEALPPEEMARIEKALRGDSALVKQLASIQARRGSGVHSLGEIWRRHRLSCPSREQLAGFLLGAVSEALTGYIAFHVEVVAAAFARQTWPTCVRSRPSPIKPHACAAASTSNRARDT